MENLIFKLDEVEMLLIMLKEAFHEKDLNLSTSSRLRLTEMLETESQKKLISKGRVDNLKNYHDIIARILAS